MAASRDVASAGGAPAGVARIAGVVLAAGLGRRMGGPKADLVVDGRRLLDRAVAALRDGGCDPVFAVVASGTAVDALTVVNADPARGQRSSVALAVAAAHASRPLDALALLLVDQPGVGADAVRATVRAWRPGRITAGSYAGRRGHPVVMSLADWERALALAGPDEGARTLLAAEYDRVDEVVVAGDLDDLDRPADLARRLSRSRLSGVGRADVVRPTVE